MKRIAIILVLALTLVGGWLWLARSGPPWTSTSAEAVEELQSCLESKMKFYHREAVGHCRRALELDPSFVMPKLTLLQLETRGEDAKELAHALQEADLGPLNERERMLVEYWRAHKAEDPEQANAVVDAYLAQHPNDPFALQLRCERFWAREDWDGADRCLEELLEAEPNWVVAQNRRGYMAMGRGRFDLAEELFRTYLYIAPDQANPHDSLGELLLLRGRYEEAEEQFRSAISMRPDFCSSYANLADLHLYTGEYARASGVVDEAAVAGACDETLLDELRCLVGVWSTLESQDWERVWEASLDPVCSSGQGAPSLLRHEAALNTGRVAEAAKFRELLGGKIDRYRDGHGYVPGWILAMQSHAEGTAQALGEDVEAAIENYMACDEYLRYWQSTGTSQFKLFNKAYLARALERAGETDRAERVRADILEVNPEFREILDRYQF